MKALLSKAASKPRALTHRELVELLTAPDAHALLAAAYAVKEREVGRKTSLRGLVEFGNICEKDCFYCGIRKSNSKANRYMMSADEIVSAAEWSYKAHYGSIVLQSGEIGSEAQVALVENVLRRIRDVAGDGFDLMNLVSPAAYHFMDAMRKTAAAARRRYYGKTVSVYAPLYIGNTCVNSCRYCDFRIQHTGTARRNLTLDEIRAEAEAVRSTGINSLLVVAGEDPRVNTVEHLAQVGRLLKPMFSNLSLEVAPQTDDGYRKLFAAGYEGLTCFQETYDRDIYREMHPAGPKADYDFRLGTQERAGRAGFRVLGCAFLLGLGPWRREAASLAAHAFYLMRECYEAKVQFAFPRICRVEGGFVPPCEVDERDLELMMLAFRIVFPQCCMTVSTREEPVFRDRIVLTAADNMSAGSRTTPGGYAILFGNRKQDVAQFTLSDSRTPDEVYAAIRANGQEVVFKNWDNRI